jgi:hypothetical protein
VDEGVVVIAAELPPGVNGYTDGVRVWLSRWLTRVEARVVLRHELEHVTRGDAGRCPPSVERRIDLAVARQLVEVDALGDAAAWSEHVTVIADELRVMPQTIVDRVETLTDGERAWLEDRLRDAHWR